MFSIYKFQRLALLLGGLCMSSIAFGAGEAVSANPETNKSTAAKELSTDKAQITILKNGLTVYVLPDERFPLVSTRLYVKAGSSTESPEDAGISHVFEHMVFKGTKKWPNNELAVAVESAGGYLNAATGFDYTVYKIDLPAKDWALGIDIVHEMAFNSTIGNTELTAEKEVVLSEVKLYEDRPQSRIFEELHGNLFKGTSYEHPIIGYEKTINAITPESIRKYIAKYYQPQNIVLSVVGNVDAQKVLEESERIFGNIQNTAEMHPSTPIDVSSLSSSSLNVQEGDWNKVYLGVALPVPGFMDVRSLDLSVLAHVLGGDATSYLYKKYKYDKQIVDSISASNYSFERVGMLYFTVQLEAKNVPLFWKEFVTDLANLKASLFSDKDIARVKLLVEDSIQRSKETISGLASNKGYTQLFLGGEQGEKNRLASLADINSEQLQEAIDTWFVPQRLNVSVLVPKGTKLPDLKADLDKIWPTTQTKSEKVSAKATGETKTIELGQGRKLILIPDATMPYTSLNLYMTGGDSLSSKVGGNSKYKPGLANLTASVLTSGTKQMTAPQINEYLAERASGLSASSGKQVFIISSSQPSRFNKDIFELFKNTMQDPTFSQEEVQREMKTQIARIRTRDDRPTSYAFSQIPSFLFGSEHPYGLKSLGDIAQVEKYSRNDILDFWKKQSQEPWVLTVAGDFNEEEVLAFARSLPKPSQKSMEIKEPMWGKKNTLDLHVPGREQAHYVLAFKSIPAHHPDAAALELLQLILAGQSGPLFNELRYRQGLGYSVTAMQNSYPTTGVFMFYIGTEPEKIEKAQAGFEKIIADVQKNLFKEEELERAKQQMEGDYYRSIQTLNSRADEASMYSILGHDIDFRKKAIETAKSKTLEDVRRVAQKYLNNGYIIKVTP